METRKNKVEKIKPLIVIGLILFIGACSTAEKKSEPSAPFSEEVISTAEEQGPPESFGPPVPEVQNVFGPEPIQLRPLTLILGPGLARGFAHAGVLQALEENKIPVSAVIACDVGAIVASAYTLNSTINAFEWALLRLKDDLFKPKKPIMSSIFKGPRDSDGKDLLEALNKVFDEKDLSDAKIPLLISLREEGSDSIELVRRGSVAQATRAAVGMQGYMTASSIDDKQFLSGCAMTPFPVNEAKKLFDSPVMIVDVSAGGKRAAFRKQEETFLLIKSARKIGETEVKEADLIIEPDVGDIGYLDFQKRMEVSFRGKNAIINNIAKIRHLVGLPGQP